MQRFAAAGFVLLVSAFPAWGQDKVVQVVIDKYRFQPQAVTVTPGTVVEWVNQEKRTNHSIIVDGQPESDRFFPGESYRYRFDKLGRFTYRCGPHPDMVGTVEVAR